MVAEICEIYGWTYNEYYSNPTWFLELINRKYQIDIKRKNKKS